LAGVVALPSSKVFSPRVPMSEGNMDETPAVDPAPRPARDDGLNLNADVPEPAGVDRGTRGANAAVFAFSGFFPAMGSYTGYSLEAYRRPVYSEYSAGCKVHSGMWSQVWLSQPGQTRCPVAGVWVKARASARPIESKWQISSSGSSMPTIRISS
jgi:hypothetical protein